MRVGLIPVTSQQVMLIRDFIPGEEILRDIFMSLSADTSLAAESFFSRHGFVVVERQTVLVRGVELANARVCKALLANNSLL